MGDISWEAVDLRISELKDKGAVAPASAPAATQVERVDWDVPTARADDPASDRDPDYRPPGGDGGGERFGGPGDFAHHFQGGMLRTSAGHVGALADMLPDVLVEPGLGEREVERGIRQGKIPAEPPSTTLGRMGETAGRLTTGGLEATAAMQMLVASFPALAASKGSGFLATLGRTMLGPMKTAPVETAAMNTGASFGGGVGGAAAGETARATGFEEYAPHAEMLGAFPGAMAGGVAALKMPGAIERGVTGTVAKAGRRTPLIRDIPAVKRANESFYESEALDEATKLLRGGQNAPAENVRRITQAEQMQERLPGTEFNTGQATGDLAYQTKVGDLTRHGQAYSGRIKGMQERTQAALKGHLDDSAPNQSSGAELLRKHVQRGVDRHLAELDANLAQVEQGVQAKLQQVGGTADYSDELARGVNDELMPWFRGKADELYAPLEQLGDRFRLPMARIRHSVQTEMAEISPAEIEQMGALPKSIKSIIDAPDVESFGNVRGIRRAINADLRQLQRGEGNSTAEHVLRRVKSALDDSLESMREAGEFVTGGGPAEAFPAATTHVDGRLIREHVPNRASIDASLTDYTELPGVRAVSLKAFTLDEAPLATDTRTLDLAKQIAAAKEINPLIVAVDAKGPYILEGGHRYDALKLLGAESFPAVVVVESTAKPFPGAQAKQISAMWREADEFYRQGVSKLRQGVTGRISGQGKGGQVAASDAAKAVANPNAAGYRERATEWGQLRDYMRSQGLDAEVEQFDASMRGYLTRDAYDSVGFGVAGKKVKADNLTRWREQNQDMLRQHPEVRDQLADVETAQRFFEAEGVSHATAVKTHEQSAAAAFLKKDVGEAIDTVLKHPDPRKAAGQLLLKAGNNDDALSGMKRAVWDRMMDDAFKDAIDDGTWKLGAAPVQVVDHKAMGRIVGSKKYQPLLEVLWGKEHLSSIRTIARAAKLAEKSHASGVTRESPEQVKQANVVSRHYFNRWARGDIKRAADGSSVLFRAGASFVDSFFEKFPAGIVTQIMEEAMADPAYAKMLLTRVTPQNIEPVSSALRTKVLPAMIGVGSQVSAPTVKKVYRHLTAPTGANERSNP